MKKAFLFLIIAAIVSPSWSQSLSTVRGKTKDGKSLQVTYYHGASEDYIETVKYQVLDELQAKVNKLQAENKDLQGKLDAANRRVKEMGENANKSTNELIENYQAQIAENKGQIQLLNLEIERLQHQLDSVNTKVSEDNQRLQKTIVEKDQHIAQLNSQQAQSQKGNSSPVIGIEGGLGLIVPLTCSNDRWTETGKTNMQFDVFYGTSSLTNAFPISIEGGVGIHKFSLSAGQNAHTYTMAANDYDGVSYNALYYYSDLQEDLALTYLDFPIRISIGQAIKNQVTLYAKFGLTPSININANYLASGTYTIKGQYSQWGIILEDIEELGFVSQQEYSEGEQPTISKFVLWGNVAFGANIPLGEIPLQLNAGVKLDYSLMSLGTAQESAAMPEGKGLLPNGGKTFIPGINIGVIYLLK